MERKNASKKKLVIIRVIVAIVCIILGGIVFNSLYKKTIFAKNEELYFRMFANAFDEGEYEFYSLDAYYFIDTGMIYYNGKYKAYIEDKWEDIDEVVYGRKGNVHNMYCRSWDELYGFEEIDKEFERAKEEGMHKEYTQEEIKELLDKAYKNKK